MNGWVAKRDSNFWTGLFLMVLSGAVISEAFELEIGTPSSPGSGFMIFGTAVVLGLLALHLFIRSILSGERKAEKSSEKIQYARIVSVIGANIVYIFLLQPVGYVLCTFLFLCFLFRVQEKGKWFSSVWGAALTSSVSYLIFSRMLQLNLPRGLMPFF